MGDPKKLKKKYSPARHPWIKGVIEEEKKVRADYGLKNKREILKANSYLKKYKDLAKKIIARRTVQSEKEKQQILRKLQTLGLLRMGAELDDILDLKLTDLLERRLQSLVYKKGLARSMDQARQFIVHRHVLVNQKEITAPSYLVSLSEEAAILFKEKSSLSSEQHPERVSLAAAAVAEEHAAVLEKKPAEEAAAE